MAKIDIGKFKVTSIQEFFLDSSVWLILNGDLGNYKIADQKFYSNILGSIIEKSAPILITSQILSEIFNVLFKKGLKDFCLINHLDIGSLNVKKDYIGTTDHSKRIDDIKTILNNILTTPNLMKIGDSFTDINLKNILNEVIKVDFNDSYYVELLKKRNNHTVLITNDSDFGYLSDKIDIYTNK